MKQHLLLSGRRIILTGGARGLGLHCASEMAKAGARIVIADRLTDIGEAKAKELRDAGHDVQFIAVDLIDSEAIVRCVEQATAALGGLDGLINNGAIATGVGGKTMDNVSSDDWDRVMAVNVRGSWQMVVAATPHLRRSDSGRIVNIASDTALWGAPRLMHYVASKGAVLAMTRSMARELGEYGIAVNAISPGLTRVEATDDVPDERYAFYRAGRAIKREQVPEDISGLIAFLMSEKSAYITGQNIPVNGGFVMN